ncbi:response regulator [Lachnospiraceae bacterium ZAX-1]
MGRKLRLCSNGIIRSDEKELDKNCDLKYIDCGGGIMKEMLKVLLVDDEYLIRNLIRMRIDWEANGLVIVGEAQNAKEALALIEQHKPDILFTDVCMPHTDGIELSRIALEKHPNIKIVIITGYDEFEYAQKSIKLGVNDFILKPIRAQELLEAVEKIKIKIEQEKAHIPKDKELLCTSNSIVMGNKTTNLIQKIRAYMEDNMHNPDLSMGEVADIFFISTGHLGRIMKQETGETFVNYLTNIRIKQAQELLKYSDLKGYQIGEKVGIKDPHYFSILFKKTTGISINEFRKQYL